MRKIFRTNLKSSNFFTNDLIKLNKAVKYVEEFINSEEFEKIVLNYSYTDYDDNKHTRFHYTTFTNQEVLSIILSGSETLTPETDSEADIQIELDNSWTRNVIGYTYPTTPTQWIYAKFFRNWSAEEIAGNIMHEYLHKLGFDHEYQYTFNREFSVNYALGYACEDYAKRTGKMSYFERFKRYFQ
jgi:hypothetical protein